MVITLCWPHQPPQRDPQSPEGSGKDAGQGALLRDTHLPLTTMPDALAGASGIVLGTGALPRASGAGTPKLGGSQQ